MFIKNLLHSGWLHALFIAVIAYPLASMTQKFVASYTDVNLLAYTCIFMLVSAITLLIMAGPGELANATLRRFETWLYAILQIISYILFLYSVVYATAAQGAALTMFGGVFIFIFSVIFLRQKANIYEFIGTIIVCISLYLIIAGTDLSIEEKTILTLIVVTRGLVVSFQKIITEVHKTNRKAVSFKSQMRVTGFIMAVASFIYLAFLILIAWFKQSHSLEFFAPFPHFKDFVNFDMVLFSVFVGVIVVSTTKYCEFYAGKSIGAKYLTSITSLQILFVYLLESTLSKAGILEQHIIDHTVVPSLVLILFGNFIISMAGFIKDLKFIKKGEKQDTLANLEDNFIDNETDFNLIKLNLANLLALYDNNSKALSKDIEISRVKLDNIANYEYGELQIKTLTAKKINDFASQHVTIKDKLTKAYNRYYLDHKANILFKSEEDFKLYYLDLNKFKPINDIHGHDAGDYVLTKTVSRLNKIKAFKDNVFRVGGDEFVLVQSKDLEKDLTSLIIETIERPMNFQDNILETSTSVGVTISNNYDNLEEMLKEADSLMYKNKKSQ